MGAVGMPMQAGVMGPPMAMPGRGMVPQHLPGPGRHLQIMDHTVHRIDSNIKANGEEEKEMVVSNLRHFTLKIGVIDRSGGGHEAELPLKAELLYENGQLVEQLATCARLVGLVCGPERPGRATELQRVAAVASATTVAVTPTPTPTPTRCEPLLVGKTQVVAMQGMALFKLRITSLSSHRDKQRFRIRVSPVDTSLLLREPHLTAVTTPMKCVTKLSHRGSGGNKEGEGEEARPAPPGPAPAPAPPPAPAPTRLASPSVRASGAAHVTALAVATLCCGPASRDSPAPPARSGRRWARTARAWRWTRRGG